MPSSVENLEAAAQIIGENMKLVQRVADEFKTYYTNHVTPESVIHWLLQFREPTAVQVALRLLEHLHFIDESKLGTLLKAALDKVPQEHRRDALFVPAGKAHDSSSHVSYSLSKALAWPEEELARRWRPFNAEIVDATVNGRPPSALILVDDNITSGTQLERLLRELSPSFIDKREHFPEPLSEQNLTKLKSIPLHVIVAVELADGAAKVMHVAKELGFDLAIHSGHRDFTRWLEYGGPIWPSPAQAEHAKLVVKEVSRELLSEKNWTPEVLSNRVLGYGNLQKLTVFQYNIPKALLPVFWKAGDYRGELWFPLFAERSEWQEKQERIQESAPSIRMISRLIATGAYGKATPSLSAAISVNGSRQAELSVVLPDDATVSGAASAYMEQLPRPKTMATPGAGTQLLFSTSADDVRDYNRAVKTYLHELEHSYAREVRARVEEAAKLIVLPVRVYNEGTRKATLTLFQLELSEGVSWTQDPSIIPPPPSLPEKPRGPHDFMVTAEVRQGSEQIRLLREIKSSLENEPSKGDHGEVNRLLAVVHDRGRTFVNVYYRGVLQGTFRDRSVQYLRVEAPGRYVLPYRLYCEESPRPTEGFFTINAVRGPVEYTKLMLQLATDVE